MLLVGKTNQILTRNLQGLRRWWWLVDEMFMVIIIVKLLCVLFTNVTCDRNNFIKGVAESVILTLVFLKGILVQKGSFRTNISSD